MNAIQDSQFGGTAMLECLDLPGPIAGNRQSEE